MTNSTTEAAATPFEGVDAGEWQALVTRGTAAGLLHGWKVSAGAGAYNLTGTSASLFHNARMAAAAGSYLVGGTDADLLAGGGTFITGTDDLQLPVDYYMEDLPQYRATGRTYEPSYGVAKSEGKVMRSGRKRLSGPSTSVTTTTDKRGYN